MDKESLLSEYAKKIYGFAYSKTKNTHDAEDLSQEILLQICNKTFDPNQIDHPDAYVYRICCYTWSNFLRKNKPAWRSLGFCEFLSETPSDECMEDNYEENELRETLRREIRYLSRIRHDITVLYYYEGKSGNDIARLLQIPPSTVRWHMKETKTRLKERLEMTEEKGFFTPVRLDIGMDGQGDCLSMGGLTDDLIMQNICVICRDKPLSVEDISCTLGISAFYLEEKIEKLLYMDFLKPVGANRYQTTFFIEDEEYQRDDLRFSYENTMRMAVPLWELARRMVPVYRKSGLVDGEFSDEFFLYSILMELICDAMENLCAQADTSMGLSWEYPKRKDGSECFVRASYRCRNHAVEQATDEDFHRYLQEQGGQGISTECTDNARSMQFFLRVFGGWRNFDHDDLAKLMRVYDLTQSGETPNDYDKEMISYLIREGYVRVDNGYPAVLVPILKDGQELRDLREKMRMDFADSYAKIDEVIRASMEKVLRYREARSRRLPAYLDKNERAFLLSRSIGFDHYDVLYLLMKNGYLYTPDKEKQKRICTLIYRTA